MIFLKTIKNILIPKSTNKLIIPQFPIKYKSNSSCKCDIPTKPIKPPPPKDDCEPPKNKKITKSNRRNEPCNKSKGGVTVTLIGGGRTTAFTCLLLKQNPGIRELKIVDTDNSLATAICDIRHIDTSTSIRRYDCTSINAALRNSDLVGILDETDLHPTKDGPITQLSQTADYIRVAAESIAGACPTALIAVLARPVTGSVPLICEILRASGSEWHPNRILGSASLEAMRANALAADFLGLQSDCLSVPLAGGPDPYCLVPLLSCTRPFGDFNNDEYCQILESLRTIDQELGESETRGPKISSAVAAAKFISTIVNGIRGESISIASGYVRSDILPGCRYMTSQLKFGPNGVEKNYGLPKLNNIEIQLVEHAVPMINKVVEYAENFSRCGQFCER